MDSLPNLPVVLGTTAVGAPLALTAVVGLPSMFGRPLRERATLQACFLTLTIGLLAVIGTAMHMIRHGLPTLIVDLGEWVAIPGYHFSVQLQFDKQSIPMIMLTFVLSAAIARFAGQYLHRESGFNRFFVLFAFFALGMVTASSAGSIETLFAGWELVGLSSVFLVSFFQDRPAPPRNGLYVWVVYRFSDAALLLAAVVLHRLTHSGDFDHVFGIGPKPKALEILSHTETLLVGGLLLIAAAGKSALIPFSGWLPRAMEGPTPSSAVFYGALSVHLGAYLLLRASPILQACPELAVATFVLGFSTAVFAYFAGSVQTDIKSALSFASLSQVGLIFAEIGLGWYDLAMFHMIGHACLRTYQFIRAPTLLHDYHLVENAIGDHLPRSAGPLGRRTPRGLRDWLYRWSFDRGFLDILLIDYFVAGFRRLFEFFERIERRWRDLLAGRRSVTVEEEDRRRPGDHDL